MSSCSGSVLCRDHYFFAVEWRGRVTCPSRLVQPTTDGVCGGSVQCTRGAVPEGEYV